MPANPMMRVNQTSHKILRKLADRKGKSMQAILEKAIKEYQRKEFFEEANTAYAALQNDSEAWKAELKEREEWETTLLDGIDSDEQWEEGVVKNG